jgi:hypothetical protein
MFRSRLWPSRMLGQGAVQQLPVPPPSGATAGLGTYDMGFRNYDPGLNRFLTRDMYGRRAG